MSSEPEIGITDDDEEKIKAAAISGHADELLPDGNHTSPIIGADDSGGNIETGSASSEHPDGDDSTATREKALNGGQFERLLIGASRLGGEEGLEAWAACVIMGRLGLRGGEFTHVTADWVDHYNGVINIPGQDDCTKGQNGGVCGKCNQAIRQRQDYGDGRSFDEIADDYWMPKTENAVRSIPYEWSARTQEAIAILIDLGGGWPYSFSTFQRRLDDALEAAPGLSQESTSSHGLRATAASYHAGNGLNREALKQMMGWTDDRTPAKYLKINGQMTQRALQEVYR